MAEERKPSSLAVDNNAMATSGSKFNDLPKEIVAEIMSRLPSESLMQCKCLNKSWYFVIKCLIKDSEFVAKHLSHAKASPATLLVYYRFVCGEELMASLITPSSSENGDNEDTHLVSEDRNLPLYFTQQGYESVHHCDGIICLTEGLRIVTLCNLALREFCMFNPETGLDINEYGILGTGFGRDLRNGNYKIVRLLNPMKAEVFNPGATNSWREIEISIQDDQYGKLKNHVHLKGKCFWLMLGVPWTVLCFDMCSEAFHVIPLPNGLEFCSSLTIRDDSLCFFWFPPVTESSNCIHMWELEFNDDGGGIEDFTYSWRKCFESEPFARNYIPLTFWQSDELLIDDADNLESFHNSQPENAYEIDDELLTHPELDRISSYNIRTRKLREAKLPDYGTLGVIFYSGPYVKSLVSIKEKRKIV